MTAKNIIALIGVAALSTSLVTACAQSGVPEHEASHDRAHSGHDHAAHDQTPQSSKAASESGSKAAGKFIKNGFDGMPAPGSDAYCPVMKQDFTVAADSAFSIYEDKMYVFCCPMCKPTFEADPKKFIDG